MLTETSVISPDSPDMTGPGYLAARRVAIVAVLFSVIVAAMMFYNDHQLKVADPLTSAELVDLRIQLQQDPGSEPLKQQIRAVDLRVRNEFYGRRRFSAVGAYLLLAGAAVAVIALKLAVSYSHTPPVPAGQLPNADARAQLATRARWSVGLLGLVLVCSAVVLAATAPPVLRPQSPAPAPHVAIMPTPAPAPIGLAKDNWPRFRGPGGLATSNYLNVPDQWDGKTNTNILWKTPLPLPGKNSPIVWGNRLFCFGATKSERQIYCLDTATGQIVWLRRVDAVQPEGTEPPEVMEDTGFAAPTGVTDGKRVYAIFANGDLVAYDFDGQKVWAIAMGVPQNNYGHATSLAMHENLLFVQFDQAYQDDGLSTLTALDGATGREVWKVPRPVSASWTSPVVIDVNGQSQLITIASPYAIAYDPKTGDEIWRCEQVYGETAPSPIFAAGLVLAVSPSDELTAIRADGTGDVTNTHVAWSTNEGVPDIVSPTANERFVYLLTTGGTLTCCSTEDGSVVWEHDLDSTFHASPVLAGERLYLTNSKGTTLIIRVGDTFEQTGRCELGEPVDSSLAMMDGRIYIRGKKHVYCIESASE